MEIQEVQEETQEPLEPEKRKRRNRVKNPRQQLDDSLKQFDEMLHNPNLKGTKQAELLIERASIQKMLWQADREDTADEAKAAIEQLTAKSSVDTAKIAELEQRLQSRVHQPTVTLQDLDTPRLRQHVNELTGLVGFLASEISDEHAKACCAIRSILKYGTAARLVVESLRLDFQFYWLGLNSNPTVETLRDMLSRCQDPDGQNAVYARSALEVIHGCKVGKPPRRRGSDDYSHLAPQFD
jgi:hypothetical protein